MTYPIRVAERWLYQTLAADPIIAGIVGERIYNQQADDAVTTDPDDDNEAEPVVPFILYQRQGGTGDIRGVGPDNFAADLVYLVRAVDRTMSYQTMDPLAERIDALLHNAFGTVTGGQVEASTREDSYSQVDPDGRHRHLGGLYKLFVTTS